MSIVVGVSGATCSGKTSVVKVLSSCFPKSFTINQDQFYHKEGDEKHQYIEALGHINWELVTAFDMDKLVEEVKANTSYESQEPSERVISPQKILQSRDEEDLRKALEGFPFKVVFVEGITLFNHLECAELCDLKYFLTLDFDDCLERRKRRTYNPPDVPGYFEAIVWPYYQKNMSEFVKTVPDVMFLTGTHAIMSHAKKIAIDIVTRAK